MPDNNPNIIITLKLENQTQKQLLFSYRIQNRDSDTCYLFNGRRMPYTIFDRPKLIRIAMSIQPYPEDCTYGVEVPFTRDLFPGDTETGEIKIDLPIQQNDHYTLLHNPDVQPSGSVRFYLEVGLSAIRVDKSNFVHVGCSNLASRQQFANSEPIRVQL